MSRKATSPARTRCKHCGVSFSPTAREAEFCCSGCRFVYHLLHKRGLEDFYRFGEPRAPVVPGVFDRRDWEWLRQAQEAAEREGNETARLSLRVQGISCAGCVWLLEAVWREQPGAVEAEVRGAEGSIVLVWRPGECDLVAYAADVQRFGYFLGPEEAGAYRQANPLGRRLGVCAAFALNAMLFALPRYLGLEPSAEMAIVFETLGFLLATASMAVGGVYFFRRAWEALRRGEIHMDLPISIGLIVAYGGSAFAWRAGVPELAYFDFVAIFTALMLLGRWLQERAVEANRRRLLGGRLDPRRIRILRNGLAVASSDVRAGERFTVSPGGLVPVRSRLLGAGAEFGMDWINGEPEPRLLAPGAVVPAGARYLGSGEPQFQALENWADSMLARLLAVGEPRRWRDPHLHRLIQVYLGAVLLVAGMGFSWWWLIGAGPVAAFQVLVSVLVVSCPCALGVALPLREELAAARAQVAGVFVRSGSLWRRLRQIRAIVFDKTGTLTLERLQLANPESLERLAPAARSALARIVRDSVHPVASCLREEVLSRGWEMPEGSAAREFPGLGMEVDDEHGTWRLGRPEWAAPPGGGEGTWLALDGVLVARFVFQEGLRPGASSFVRELAAGGREVVILSGDAPAKVRGLARELGLRADAGLGGLLPEAKARVIRQRWDGQVLLLGDGANDSFAFDAALCRGTPAVETGGLENKADFYILGRGLEGLRELFWAAKAHRLAGRRVFLFAVLYNSLAVGAALAGVMNPLVAAVIMPLSSLASIAIVLAHFPPRNSPFTL